METKKKITVIITVMLFAALILCPALARKYDTMMVGVDRWIDTGYEDVQCGQVNKSDTEEPNKIAFESISTEEPNVITYDGQLEPNSITLIYYAAEHPEHPNDIDIDEFEPNLVIFRQSGEHPNSIDYTEDVEPNNAIIFVGTEHPEEPNEISNEEDTEPNEIEKIIFDEGTANSRKKSNIAKS